MRNNKLLLLLALLLMAVTGAWAQGSGGNNWGPVQTSSAAWTALTEGSTTGMTLCNRYLSPVSLIISLTIKKTKQV